MKMNSNLLFLLIFFCCFSCTKEANSEEQELKNEVKCNENKCTGNYIGLEFVNGSDVAHQFSNKMSEVVGDQLKALYRQGKFSKVDFETIHMSTEGMGTGSVIYTLTIPFIPVNERCEAYTSFDHVGGWNHSPNLSKRKQELSGALIEGHQLSISNLKTTPEGLQEYWIQWKNKVVQSDCD